jgi:hypothetical protein
MHSEGMEINLRDTAVIERMGEVDVNEIRVKVFKDKGW